MSDLINLELRFFLSSILWGIILLVIYDCVRIFRRLIKHGKFFVAFEDILYWIISGLLIFIMMYKQNNGTIRGFSIMGMVLGMIVYNRSISNYFVNGISKLIYKVCSFLKKGFELLLSPVRFILKRVQWILSFAGQKIKKIIRTLLKRLKKRMKTFKIVARRK